MNTEPTPPGTVLAAQILLGLAFIVGFLLAVPGGPFFKSASVGTVASFVVFSITGTVAWVVGWAAQEGWAALRLGFCTVLALVCLWTGLARVDVHPAHWLQLGALVGAGVLLYAPATQEWFALRHAQRTNPVCAAAMWQFTQARRLEEKIAPAGIEAFIGMCVALAGCAAAAALMLSLAPT